VTAVLRGERCPKMNATDGQTDSACVWAALGGIRSGPSSPTEVLSSASTPRALLHSTQQHGEAGRRSCSVAGDGVCYIHTSQQHPIAQPTLSPCSAMPSRHHFITTDHAVIPSPPHASMPLLPAKAPSCSLHSSTSRLPSVPVGSNHALVAPGRGCFTEGHQQHVWGQSCPPCLLRLAWSAIFCGCW
jgi:hypothetical protein